MRYSCFTGFVVLAIGGCFAPTTIDPDDLGTTTDTSATSGTIDTSMSATDPSTPTTTVADTSTDPTDPTDPTDTSCTDECDLEGTGCNAGALETCAVGASGCLELDVMPCKNGCDESGCIGESADLAISIVSAVWLQTDLQITYVVANLGAGASGDYRVDLWADRPGGFDGPPSVGEIGNAGVAKPGLAAGEATQFTDAVPMAPNGRHVAFAVIDPDAVVAETDENNNVSLGFAWTNTDGEIHTSFGAPQAPLEIPDDGTPLETSIQVAAGVVAPEVWVSLNATHPEVADLTIEIVAPDGQSRVLAGPIPSGSDLGGTTFRDGVGTVLAAPFLGEFEPATPWGAVPPAEGTWTLRITDGVVGNAGRVNDWSVSLLD